MSSKTKNLVFLFPGKKKKSSSAPELHDLHVMCSLSGLSGPLSFYLRCFDPLHRYWCSLLKCSLARTETEEDRKKEREERVTGWVGETEGGTRVSRGSEWLECAPRLSEWAARWAGGGCRYCVEAAGVRVAVTDTKNNISRQETLWPGVDAPLVSTGLFLMLLLTFLTWKNTILWLEHYCN